MLEVRQLSASYGHHRALEGVSLRVEPGEIVVILGANGAGKSTLLKAISGICEGKVSGSITMSGHELVGERPDRIVEEGIALVPEGRGIFGDLTVEENLLLGAYPGRAKEEETANIDRVYTLFPKLRERRGQVARTMSGGEQQMVAVGRAMMSNPAVLTLDEPSLGLSPLLCKDLFQSLKRVGETGIGILLVEQNARASLAIADRGYLLENAHIIHEDSAAKLIGDPAVQKAYLGGAASAGLRKGRAGTKPAPAMPAPSAPRPQSGLSPTDIAAAAMQSFAPRPVPAPAPPPAAASPMAAPPARAPAQPPAPKRANGAAQPRPGDVHGIEIDSLVARARDASSRKAQTPMRHPPQSIPQSTRAAPTTPMPDLAAHGDRLKQVLDEIEQAAARAQNRSKTRPDRHGR
jgi:branched-chain amino acid transport system ATP-binding protein